MENTTELSSEQITTEIQDTGADTFEISPYMINDSNFVGYESNEQQEQIYKLATFGIIGPNTKSVLDFGCGRGDLGSFINKTINPEIVYNGLDVNQLMIDIGKEKYKNFPAVNISNQDYFKLTEENNLGYQADWVFNISNLTIPYGFHNGDYIQQFKDLLEVSLNHSVYGTVFILLNNKNKFDGYIQYNTSDIVSIIESLNLRYAVDNTDQSNIFKLVIFKEPFNF